LVLRKHLFVETGESIGGLKAERKKEMPGGRRKSLQRKARR
jgi:hypothetical protein